MRWDDSYSFVGRQPPARATIRKSGDAVSGDGRTRLYERNTQVVPFAQTDYLMHEDSMQSLAHFGIPGMKWGLRRYQNEDGTLTEEGKKRYGRDSEPESKSWKKADADQLSDEELRRRNNRLQSERQYRDLTTTQAEKDKAQEDQFRTNLKNEIKKDLLKKALIVPIGAVLAYAGTKLIKNKGTKILDQFTHYGKKKIASLKAANILKNILKGENVPDRGHYNPLRDYALGKHPEWKDIDLRKRL